MVTTDPDADLLDRVGRQYRPELMSRRRRDDFLFLGVWTLLSPLTLWLAGTRITQASIVGLVVAGAVSACVVWRLHARRGREPMERRLDRELRYSRPCAQCGPLVFAFERACPKCGSSKPSGADPAIDRWMPLMLLAALMLCVVAVAGLWK
jgi:hypothetical protein